MVVLLVYGVSRSLLVVRHPPELVTTTFPYRRTIDMREMLVIFFWCHIFSFIFVKSEASVVDNVPMVSYWKTNEIRIMSNSDSDVISSQWLNLNVGLYWYTSHMYILLEVGCCYVTTIKNQKKKKKSEKSIEAWTQHSPIRQHVTSSCYFHPSGVCIVVYIIMRWIVLSLGPFIR